MSIFWGILGNFLGGKKTIHIKQLFYPLPYFFGTLFDVNLNKFNWYIVMFLTY